MQIYFLEKSKVQALSEFVAHEMAIELVFTSRAYLQGVDHTV